MRRTLLLIAALTATSGCENTGAQTDPLISNELVARSLQVNALSTLVGTELSLVASEPPQDFSSCPEVSQSGDVWTFDYGPEGCVPDSGLTEDVVVGTVSLTVAGGSGAFLGTVTDMGVGDSTLVAEVSGSTSTAGDLVTADVDMGTMTWTRGQVSFTYDAFLELEGNSESISVYVDSGELLGGDEVPLFVNVEDASTPRGTLGGCFVPSAGGIELLRERGRTNLDFSEETHGASSVTATHNDRDPESVSPCGS